MLFLSLIFNFIILQTLPYFWTLTYWLFYPNIQLAGVISVVPSHWEGMQTDKAVGVFPQLYWIPIQSHLIHVGSDVVAAVTFAERLICYWWYLVVLQKRQKDKINKKILHFFPLNSWLIILRLHASAQHKETRAAWALPSAHCFQGRGMPVL